jgi:hypothetical protein
MLAVAVDQRLSMIPGALPAAAVVHPQLAQMETLTLATPTV